MRVLLYTDNPFFSGAENMIANFLSDPEFVDEFDVRFAFRSSESFEHGLAARVCTAAPMIPLKLKDVPSATATVPSVVRPTAKAVAYLTGAKYRYLRHNIEVLKPVFAREKPDILHINSGGYPGAYSSLAAALAARNAGVPHVVYVANNIAMGYGWRRRLDRPYDEQVAKAVEVFVTGSSFAGAALAEVLGLPASKRRVIPNGIRMREIIEQRDAVRSRIGAPAGRPVVAVIANLEERKGHGYLIEALALLKAQGVSPLPWVAIEGEGPQESELRERVVANDLVGDIGFLAREKHVFDLMNAADIIALPSIANEDFPNVVLEAMSLSKPVVASRLAGTPEQIVDGETGLLVEPADSRALSSALARLAGDADLRERFGAAGRERYESCFTAQVAVDSYRKLYRSL